MPIRDQSYCSWDSSGFNLRVSIVCLKVVLTLSTGPLREKKLYKYESMLEIKLTLAESKICVARISPKPENRRIYSV